LACGPAAAQRSYLEGLACCTGPTSSGGSDGEPQRSGAAACSAGDAVASRAAGVAGPEPPAPGLEAGNATGGGREPSAAPDAAHAGGPTVRPAEETEIADASTAGAAGVAGPEPPAPGLEAGNATGRGREPGAVPGAAHAGNRAVRPAEETEIADGSTSGAPVRPPRAAAPAPAGSEAASSCASGGAAQEGRGDGAPRAAPGPACAPASVAGSNVPPTPAGGSEMAQHPPRPAGPRCGAPGVGAPGGGGGHGPDVRAAEQRADEALRVRRPLCLLLGAVAPCSALWALVTGAKPLTRR